MIEAKQGNEKNPLLFQEKKYVKTIHKGGRHQVLRLYEKNMAAEQTCSANRILQDIITTLMLNSITTVELLILFALL